MKAKSALIAAIATVGIASAAQADQVFVDLTGGQSWGGFAPTPAGSPNSDFFVAGLGIGTQVTQIEFVNLNVDVLGASYANEFVVSVNDWDGVTYTNYWDSTVPGAPAASVDIVNANSPFNNPGQFGSGPFTMTRPDLWITLYETFNDGGNGVQDAQVLSGGILITYTPIPAPGALALLGLAGMVGSRRRR